MLGVNTTHARLPTWREIDQPAVQRNSLKLGVRDVRGIPKEPALLHEQKLRFGSEGDHFASI